MNGLYAAGTNNHFIVAIELWWDVKTFGLRCNQVFLFGVKKQKNGKQRLIDDFRWTGDENKFVKAFAQRNA